MNRIAASLRSAVALLAAAAGAGPAIPEQADPHRRAVRRRAAPPTSSRARSGRTSPTAWSQPVIVENRTGANGNVGADYVAKSAPDGYTMLLSDVGALAINPSVYPDMPFDPVKDFSPIVMVSYSPHVLAVHPSVPVSNVKELIAYAKANPGQDEFRQLRHRRRAAPGGRRFRCAHRRAVGLHPLQGRLGGGRRRDRGQFQRAVQRHARHLPVREGRPPEGARGVERRSAFPRRPNCPRLSNPACPAS